MVLIPTIHCCNDVRSGSLRHIWGEEETKEWLKGVQVNTPKVYPKNSPQVRAVDEGKLEIGWVNHYYLHQLDKENTNAKITPFPSKMAEIS